MTFALVETQTPVERHCFGDRGRDQTRKDAAKPAAVIDDDQIGIRGDRIDEIGEARLLAAGIEISPQIAVRRGAAK